MTPWLLKWNAEHVTGARTTHFTRSIVMTSSVTPSSTSLIGLFEIPQLCRGGMKTKTTTNYRSTFSSAKIALCSTELSIVHYSCAYCRHLKCDFLFNCAAVDKISTDIGLARRAVHLRSLSFLLNFGTLPFFGTAGARHFNFDAQIDRIDYAQIQCVHGQYWPLKFGQ